MKDKVRVNMANPHELLEIPGINATQAETIVRFRAEHGPITSTAVLAGLLGTTSLAPSISDHIDFAPAADTAAEAPGA
ncbi:MAG TPA: helix-hairpin-helix domain-containing protein [Methylomirabilota bacterium]|jgi:hypothetical protein|nr:helix-hairpin-helix domain-containing protein [Methylomirabilota bacterium]